MEMQVKEIPFVDFPKDQEMGQPLPDGRYAVISHDPGYRGRHALVPTAFPWHTRIVDFQGAVLDERGGGSNAGEELSRYDVKLVFLIGLNTAERAELDANLAKKDIKLVRDELEQLKLLLLQDRAVMITGADFMAINYGSGEFAGGRDSVVTSGSGHFRIARKTGEWKFDRQPNVRLSEASHVNVEHATSKLTFEEIRPK
jgi:hypothetical protein